MGLNNVLNKGFTPKGFLMGVNMHSNASSNLFIALPNDQDVIFECYC